MCKVIINCCLVLKFFCIPVFTAKKMYLNILIYFRRELLEKVMNLFFFVDKMYLLNGVLCILFTYLLITDVLYLTVLYRVYYNTLRWEGLCSNVH